MRIGAHWIEDVEVIPRFLENRRNSLSAFAELQLVEEPDTKGISPVHVSHVPGVPAAFRLPLAELFADKGVRPIFPYCSLDQ